MVLFPEYENPNLTYDDIASPWRTQWQQILGETADEANPMFEELIHANSSTESGKLLTQHGLDTGNRRVEGTVQQGIDSQFRQVIGTTTRGR